MTLKHRRTALHAVLAASLALSGCASADAPAGPPKTRDEAYNNVLQRVYDKNPDEGWWQAIDEARYRLGTLTLSTSYRLDQGEDLVAATLLCRAIVEEIDPSGVSAGVNVQGILVRGRRQADGSIATREDDTWRIAAGGTSDNREPAYCVAKATLPNAMEYLDSQGWVDARTLVGIDDRAARREKLATLNIYDKGFHWEAEQLEDGTWVYFGR